MTEEELPKPYVDEMPIDQLPKGTEPDPDGMAAGRYREEVDGVTVEAGAIDCYRLGSRRFFVYRPDSAKLDPRVVELVRTSTSPDLRREMGL